MIRTKLRFPSMLRASLGYSDQTSTFASEISRSGAALNMMAGWGDSDARPPNRLYSQVDTSLVYGGPGETRTHNLQLRRLTRYPLRYGSKFVRRSDHHYSIRYGWLALARIRGGRRAKSFILWRGIECLSRAFQSLRSFSAEPGRAPGRNPSFPLRFSIRWPIGRDARHSS